MENEIKDTRPKAYVWSEEKKDFVVDEWLSSGDNRYKQTISPSVSRTVSPVKGRVNK